MTVIRSRGVPRAGFTLIELLVVIAIIAILVSLSAAGVMKVLWKIPEVQTRTEIGEFDTALGSFMADYGLSDPPPSVLVLNEASPQSGPSGPFLTKVFGKNLGPTDWNGDGTIGGTWVLEGEQCLVFYLGGIPNTQQVAGGSARAGLGFSTNNMKPSFGSMATETMGARRGPYFQFQSSRLVAGPAASANFFMYIDAWKSKTSPLYSTLGGSPYAYFSSNGLNNTGYLSNGMLDCQSIGAAPYRDASTPPNFTFSNKYQIISAGQNGQFGAGVWTPSNGAPDVAGRDDQANFSRLLLGAGQQ
jgi:general secretion pathway protein G